MLDQYRTMPIQELFAQMRQHHQLLRQLYPGAPLPEAQHQTYCLQMQLLESIAANATNYEDLLMQLTNGVVLYEVVERFVEAGGWHNPEVVLAIGRGYPQFALALKTNLMRDLEQNGLVDLLRDVLH